MAVKVPGFLLKRLYVKGSLRNTPEGFSLSLKNSLGSGYAQGMLPVVVDGTAMALEQSFFQADGNEVVFTQVTKEAPFTLGMNRDTIIVVKGKTLSAGAHKVGMGFNVVGLGDLSFEIVDEIKA